MGDRRYELVVGTTNAAKGRELVELLSPLGLHVRTLLDEGGALEVVEDGETFADNARKKAVEQAQHLNAWVLADDSGLEVDALSGRPGVYSARYAGPSATDAQNNEQLLEELDGVESAKRGARYYCHVALADPQGQIRCESSAVCGGRIRSQASGSGGFGYDPLFEVVEYHKTFGELGPHVKSAISHRARAMRAIAAQISVIVESGLWTTL